MSKESSTTGVSRGIPTARNVDHIGYNVPNLDEAITFFVNVLGAELLYRAGPFGRPDSDFMASQYNVHARATVNIAVLRVGPVTNIELLEWQAPDQNLATPKNSDVGASHLAFFVEDMDAAIAYLRTLTGVSMPAQPVTSPPGPTAGQKSIYFLTPWGMQMELRWFPEGMPYEKGTTARLFGPAQSWK